MFDVGTVVLHPKRPEWGPGKILEMSSILMSRLAPLGARDLIDIQSFIFLLGDSGGAG